MTGQMRQSDEAYLTHRAALVDYASRILGSREAAEDIVQEAFLRLAPARSDDLTPRQRLAYLYRIVRNLAFDMLRRRRIESRGQAEDAPFWITPQPSETPEEALLLRDQARIAAETLATLPPDIRQALEMYRFGGQTLEAVASHLGISVATAHRHVRMAMVRIAVALDEEKT